MLNQDIQSDDAKAWKLPFSTISVGDKDVFELQYPPPPSRHLFDLNGLTVNLFLAAGHKETTCRMWAEVGDVPFTAECSQRREAMFQVLRGSKSLENVKLVLERNQRVLAMYESKINEDCTLDALMMEILLFARETEAFLPLIKKYGLK